jgi:hypothetical protein
MALGAVLTGILTLALLAAPLAAGAQLKIPRISYLSQRSGPSALDEAFRRGSAIWATWRARTSRSNTGGPASARIEFSPTSENSFVSTVDLIVTTGGTAAALTAKQVTSTIPIVFTGGDPVGPARSGGNATGVSTIQGDRVIQGTREWDDSWPGASSIRRSRLSWHRSRCSFSSRWIRKQSPCRRGAQIGGNALSLSSRTDSQACGRPYAFTMALRRYPGG